MNSTHSIPQLSFPIVASLNGVYTYTRTQKAELENVCTDNTSVVWKEYHDMFLLCLVATDTTLTTVHLKHTLDVIFQTMVFYLGLDDLLSLKNIERVKKDLKVTHPNSFHFIHSFHILTFYFCRFAIHSLIQFLIVSIPKKIGITSATLPAAATC